ncbi:MAG: GNAT family N-acetyltransferase [Deltaproteobacteria bacterium]|nr:GNAT family N-acetyltransferase [Deltaproteobacteria bacterium]
MKSNRLVTARLELIAATVTHLDAELESPARLAALLDVAVEPGWPPGEYDRGAQEFFRQRLAEGGAAVAGWFTWYAVRRRRADEPPVLVGAGGYCGPPSEAGEVEIGFSVMPGWQGWGYATEIAGALAAHAFSEAGVRKVVAHTAPDNAASGRVLEKAGFDRVGSDDGQHRFELRRPLTGCGAPQAEG